MSRQELETQYTNLPTGDVMKMKDTYSKFETLAVLGVVFPKERTRK
jgi:hypothetical protein